MKLYDKIRILRKARGLSQEAFGEMMNVTRQSVSDWENGKTEPVLNNVRDIAKYLNVSFDALLDEDINLEDPKQLNMVLKNLSPLQINSFNRKYRYSLYQNKSPKRLICYILLELIALALAITFFSLGDGLGGYALVLGGIFAGACFGAFPFLIISIISTIKGDNGNYVGEINNTHLIIKVYGEIQNVLYIPINDIDEFALEKKSKGKPRTLSIKVKDKKQRIRIERIAKADQVVKVFNKIINFTESDDAIQIL